MTTTQPPRVLVVDDEENIRFLVGSAFELAGFTTALVETGQEALDAVESFRPDLVVFDVLLPDINGFTILQRLRDRGPGPKVIFLTAHDATQDRVRGLTTGGVDSQTFYGAGGDAEAYRAELAGECAARRSVARAAPMLTVGELLERWLLADHPWRPSTWVGYRANARSLGQDRVLARTRVASLTPRQVRQAFARWEATGKTPSVIVGRFGVLRAAIGWAYDERIIDHHPIRTMRGPTRPEPRRPVDPGDVARLLATAEHRLLEAFANDDGSLMSRRLLQAAEQDLLMIRIAADSGARRGELAGLQFEDLTGRVLTITRAVSVNQIGPTKSGRPRPLTLGASTVAVWHTLAEQWQHRLPTCRALGPWVFAADPAHRKRLSLSVFDHRFRPIRDQAGVPDASLHRFRHSVATFLVNRGEILQAQARLGHSDAATTLRTYGHALSLSDVNIADAINDQLDQLPADPARAPIDDRPESN